MINYDVFISCKSEDYPYAHLIYKFLTDELGYVVFLADAELRKKGDAEYGEVIDEALDSAEHLILFSSKVEYINSSYVRNEWRTFLEEKRSGRKPGNILTVLKDVTISSLPISLRHFQSFTYDRYKDVKDFLPHSTPKHSSISTPAPAKTYKVGDYYNDGVREGVVFEVSADGKSGKIVSMEQSAEELPWTSDIEERGNLLSADSETDGALNMSKVMNITGWQSKFPAFKWCADLGRGWYLPSIKELENFTLNSSVYNAVNRTLSAKGGAMLFNAESQKAYWSSTETKYMRDCTFCVCLVYIGDDECDTDSKWCGFYVRAVATFGDEFSMNKKIYNPIMSGKTYKIGDYYCENGREGVVFEVSDNGRHGKIVSMKQSAGRLQWASDGIEQKRFIGTNSETDGAVNMAKVKSISGWRNKYPAFRWCADLGEEWYLPAVEELVVLTLNNSVREVVNRTLSAKGGIKLYNREEQECYWSSSESPLQYGDGSCCSWAITVEIYESDIWNSDKSFDHYVRAVSAF